MPWNPAAQAGGSDVGRSLDALYDEMNEAIARVARQYHASKPSM
jgi:hypothetical protein